MKRILTISALVTMLGGLLAGPAAAQYPPSAAAVEVSTSELVPGERLSVSSDGWGPDSEVEVWLHSTPRLVDTFTADGAGAFDASIDIPADMETGSHTLRLIGTDPDGGERTVELPVTVVAAPALVAQDALTSTGRDYRLGTVVLVVMLAAGAIAFVRTRSRVAV